MEALEKDDFVSTDSLWMLLGRTVTAKEGLVGLPHAFPRTRSNLSKSPLTQTGYVAMHGLNLTFYEAVTPDGWILSLWRVRSMKIFDEKLSAPVIVSHGLASSAIDFMLNLRNQSTAFILADNGYDIWLTNYRANQFSNRIMSNGKPRRPEPVDYYRAT